MTSVLLVALFVRSPSVAQQVTLDRPGTSKLTGKIKTVADGSAAGFHVLARHLSTEHVFSSPVTERDGEYRIEGVPYGYYELAIEMPGGLIVADRVVNVPPSGKLGIVLTLQPSAIARAENGASPPRFPGSDQRVLGTAVVSERLRGRDFWMSPTGVGILAGIGGLALLALVAADDDDDPPVTTF